MVRSNRVFWYRCRSFEDGGESNREFVSRLLLLKLSVIFNARCPSQTLSGLEKIRFYDFDIAISQSGHCSKSGWLT